MSNVLRNRLNELATQFATSVLSAIRGASLEELLAETSPGARLTLALPTSRGLGGSLPRSRGVRAVAGRMPSSLGARASGRLARRSPDQIAGVVDRIVGLLRQNPRGLRAEQIRARLGLLAKEMPRPLKDALAAGRLGKSGQKRSTLYFVKGGGAVAKGPGPKKALPRAARKARRASSASGSASGSPSGTRRAGRAGRAGRRPKAKARRGKSAAPSRARRKAARPRARGRSPKATKRASMGRKAAPAAAPATAAPAPVPAS
jgi:hypothetical protein